jgi:tetratricopeptide (TPR) repeat protein
MRNDGDERALTPEERLAYARVLVQIGELREAESQLAAALEERADDLGALDLLARIKHMRGELTGAIALWAQVHERSPRSQTGLLRLSSLLQMARDTERGGGEFLVLGHFQLWRKPAAHIELEEVFRKFLARRPDEARERCDALARKYQGRDADTYKLAVLAKAWIAELSGDLDVARGILEELGKERGFETDSDRVLALARLYEQIGAPELLEKAVHIYQFFERNYEKVSVLGHLASLHRRRGRAAEAARYEAKFLELFRRRMHQPTRAEASRVAARVYVPLQKLRGARFGDAALGEASPRERAIDAALRGDLSGARALLRDKRGPLDVKYQADLADLAGDRDQAVELYGKALALDDDTQISSWLLLEYGRSRASRIAELFRKADALDRAEEQLRTALRFDPVSPLLWRQLESLYRLQGRIAEAERCAHRADALDEAPSRQRATVGRALATAVYHFVGKARGLIHEIWALRKPAPRGRGGFLDEILGNLTPEMTQAARNAFLSTREYARAKWPHRTRDILDYSYTYKVTKEDEPSGGLSAGVPTALAFLSVFLDRPLPQDTASTGVLISDAHDVLVVRPVGEPEYKVRGACNRGITRLILPEGNRRDLQASALVPSAVCDEIVRYAADFDQVVRLTFGDDVFLQ